MCDVYCPIWWQAVILMSVSCRKFWIGSLKMERPARQQVHSLCLHAQILPLLISRKGAWATKPVFVGQIGFRLQFFLLPPTDLMVLRLHKGFLSPSLVIWALFNFFLVPSLVQAAPRPGLWPCFTLQLPLGWSSRSLGGHPPKQ